MLLFLFLNPISNKIIKTRILIFIFTIISLTSPQQLSKKFQKLHQFKGKMQQDVKYLSDALKKQYEDSCPDNLISCSEKSFNICEGTGERQCIQSFPTPSGCLGEGIKLSSQSGCRIPDNFNKNLSNTLRQFVCASALIQDKFHQIQKYNDKQFTYAYIGSSTGATRVSPSFKQIINKTTNSCKNYDPRKRPWYISAITGSKTTIILLDVSRSMISLYPGSRFQNAKVTLQTIINTLNSFDKVGVVIFSNTAQSVGYSKIVEGSDTVKNLLLQQVQKLQVRDGGTNYIAAIQKGMQMLQGQQFSCQSLVFLLLTDGYFQGDQSNSTQLSQLIDSQLLQLKRQKDNFKLISFVYGRQDNINYTAIRSLTCFYNGIIFRMWDGINQYEMIQKLTSYYIFLSEGVSENQIKPRWSMPYIDAFGFGMIVSVTMPIYVSSRKLNKIIGVAAIDVLMSKFLSFELTQQQIVQQLQSKQPRCFKSTLNQSQLCYLRLKQGNISCSQNCQGQFKLSTRQYCIENITDDLFKPSLDASNDQNRCCIMLISTFLGVLFGCISFVLVVIILVFMFVHKKPECLFKRFSAKKQEKVVQPSQSCRSSLISDKNLLLDPEKKYERAGDQGIKIYYQSQFKFQ